MNQYEVDPARGPEQLRQQQLELLRHVAREVVRRIAAANNGTPSEARNVDIKKGSAQRKTTR
jgi:formamidopyrimidine-DNA glycosylase